MKQMSGLPEGKEINIPVGSDYFRDYARLLAVAVAAKDGYTKGVVQVTHLYGKDFYMVPSETMDSILEALAAVEDLL